MSIKKIITITPELLEGTGCFMLVFDASWLRLFGKVPTFDVLLDSKRRLAIITRESLQK